MHKIFSAESKTVLVTGANGFVGQPLCAVMHQHGWHVKAAVRSACHFPDGVELVSVGAIDSQTDWTEALTGVDVVIHLAARVHVMKDVSADPLADFLEINLYGTVNLARQAACAGVKRLVFVSSIKVHGEETSSQRSYTEQDEPAPQDPYGVSKWEAEQALQHIEQATGLEVVIVRPPLVYGPGVGGNFLRLLILVARSIPLPLSLVENRRSMIYLGNFLDVLATCACHLGAVGKTFLVSDGESISTAQLIRDLARLMGKHSFMWPLPSALLRFVGRFVGRVDETERLLGSLLIDSSKIRRELEWMPPFSMERGLTETVRWFQARRGHV